MLNRFLMLLLPLALGCQDIPTNPDGPMAPARVKTPSTPAPAPDANPPVADGFDFDTADRDDKAKEKNKGKKGKGKAKGKNKAKSKADDLSALELQARLLGLDPAAALPPPAPAPPRMDGDDDPWQPGDALDGSFGVRLVSTVPDAQPPRAIIGLPDGTEKVVKPGTFIPKARIVVLAVGRNAVQIASFKPRGDHVRVKTRTITSLFPSAPVPVAPAVASP